MNTPRCSSAFLLRPFSKPSGAGRAIAFVCLLVSLNLKAQVTGDVISIGNSLTAGLQGDSRGVITCAAQGNRVVRADDQPSCRGNGVDGVGGWQPRLKSLLEVRVYNYGNSSEVTSQMAARLPGHMTSRSSQFVLIMGGTNDVIRGVSRSTIIANLSTMVRAAYSDGRVPIVATVPPLIGGRFNSSNGGIIQLNAEILTMTNDFPELVVADMYSLLEPNWAQNNSGDTIHLGALGNQIVADAWLAAIQKAVTPEPSVDITPILQLLLDE